MPRVLSQTVAAALNNLSENAQAQFLAQHADLRRCGVVVGEALPEITIDGVLEPSAQSSNGADQEEAGAVSQEESANPVSEVRGQQL